MKIKISNYIVSIEKQTSLNSKIPIIETQAICNDKKSIENPKNNDMQNLEDSSNESKIGEYVQYQMRLLSNKNILSIQDIQKLKDLSYCKTEFNITFCVLIDQKLSVKDDKGYPRYYANDLYFNNYRLTSQWKESHRKPFLNWLKKHIDIEVLNHKPTSSNTILPIELIPNNNEVFLETLLKTKKATISTFYKNGKQENKIWNASKMNVESNVLGNLRSRPEYRNPNWQKANIVKVVVEVIKNNKEELAIQNAPMKTKTNQGRLDGENLSVSYFILDENWFGKNKTITVKFIGGKYDGEIFKYYHDEVYKNTISHYSKLKCWRNYGRFSNSSNIPDIAKPFVTEI